MVFKHFDIATKRLRISGLTNNASGGKPIVAIHGWLDNAASFIPLVEELDCQRPFYAMELPGHGYSEHRPKSSAYHLIDNIVDVLAFLDEISPDEPVDIVGHSLGGIVACLVAASAPDRVKRIVLLDSLGPYTDQLANVLPQLRKAVSKALAVSRSKLAVYPDLEKAANVRMLGVGKVTLESAKLLVERGTKEYGEGFCWRSDPRLMDPSMLRFSEKQVKEIFSGIECPVLLICGDSGYFSDYTALEERLSYINNISKHIVAGGHHFHMEGDVNKTARAINDFLES